MACGRTSTVAAFFSPSASRAPRMYSNCDSSMNTIELWPRLVFGPYSMNRLGNPDTASPR
jgi:hypothetical protein